MIRYPDHLARQNRNTNGDRHPEGTEGNDVEVEGAYGRSNQCSDKSKSCRSKCIFRRGLKYDNSRSHRPNSTDARCVGMKYTGEIKSGR